jgi:hypothetical protein
MKKIILLCMQLLFVGPLFGQANLQLSASWIEVETSGAGQLELRVYQQFADVEGPTAGSLSLNEYRWNTATQSYDSSALRSNLVLPLHSSFTSVQNLYYPNCDPWIGSQPCSLQRIAVYKATVPTPAVNVDTALLRYTLSTRGVLGIQNAHLPDTITALCYTDFVYLRQQTSPQYSPKIEISESWHRYFPVFWPMEPGTGTFINSYLPFSFSSSPRFAGFDQLWVDFIPENNQLVPADSFLPAHADSNFNFFLHPNSPLQLGIRNLTLNEEARWANPLLLWNQVGPGFRHKTHVFLVGNIAPAMASHVAEWGEIGPVVRVQLFDMLGRLHYEGAELSDFRGDRSQLYLLREFDRQGRMRARKVRLVDY